MENQGSRSSLLEAGTVAVLTGVALGVWGGAGIPYAVLLVGAGIAAIVYDRRTRSEFDTLWKNLNLCRGGAYPRLEEKTETAAELCYRFWVPCGLGAEDFEKNRSAITQYFGREVRIRREEKRICIWVEKGTPSVTEQSRSDRPGYRPARRR